MYKEILCFPDDSLISASPTTTATKHTNKLVRRRASVFIKNPLSSARRLHSPAVNDLQSKNIFYVVKVGIVFSLKKLIIIHQFSSSSSPPPLQS